MSTDSQILNGWLICPHLAFDLQADYVQADEELYSKLDRVMRLKRWAYEKRVR